MLPFSILAMSDWETPARDASSRCDRSRRLRICLISSRFGSWGMSVRFSEDVRNGTL